MPACCLLLGQCVSASSYLRKLFISQMDICHSMVHPEEVHVMLPWSRERSRSMTDEEFDYACDQADTFGGLVDSISSGMQLLRV
jgi:hypothetical protein